MHPVVRELLCRVATKIDEDPDKFLRNAKTLKRRLKKKLQSKEFQGKLEEVGNEARRRLMRALAEKLRTL